ncbi:MAG: 3-isopropylmalate dehydratase small subunit [bacterium]|nr:3-isopropylmalate dehydratase small subunit [bacterium]
MRLTGRVHKFGDNINTDYIISGKYKFKTLDMDELAKHLFEDLEPGFYNRIDPGDFIVAGSNFGCGSSREQAPLVIKHAGISSVIACSFSRIFYRNSINVGLPLIEYDTSRISQGDELIVDLENGTISNKTKGEMIEARTLPRIMREILKEGGLVPYFKKYKGFRF